MNCLGIIVGLATFIIIGIFHPLVIKAEYHLGKRCWWMFALAGVAFAVLSLFIKSLVWATITGVTAFSCFWSIHELIEQENRVKKGWFPAYIVNFGRAAISSDIGVFLTAERPSIVAADIPPSRQNW